jgi:hypothetical protein
VPATATAAGARTSDQQEAPDIFQKSDEEFKIPETLESTEKELLMGHGLQLFRVTTAMDDAVKGTIQGEVAKGNIKASNRQSILEIKETVDEKVPELMRPDIQEIASAVGALLKKDESRPESNKKRTAKTEQQKRQEEAGVLKVVQNRAKNDQSKRHLFLAKYIGINLIKDDQTRTITSVEYSVEDKIWFVRATLAQKHPYDDRFYVQVPSTSDIVRINVGGNLSKYIKAFNSRS